MKRSMNSNIPTTFLLHWPPLVISFRMKPFFINHITKMQVNIAPSGINILAVMLSKIVKKSTPNNPKNVTALSAIDTPVVRSAPLLRDSLNSSAV